MKINIALLKYKEHIQKEIIKHKPIKIKHLPQRIKKNYGPLFWVKFVHQNLNNRPFVLGTASDTTPKNRHDKLVLLQGGGRGGGV